MNPRKLSDSALIAELKRLVVQERKNIVDILRCLAVLEDRDLALKHAYPSTYTFCVEELKYAEGAAYRLARVVKVTRRLPRVLTMLRKGRITLTAVSLLSPHLTKENYSRLLTEASGKTTREVESLVASIAPKIEPREFIRVLAPKPVEAGLGLKIETPPLPEPPPVEPPEPEKPPMRVHFSFSADEALLAKIKRAREILWHRFPSGRLEHIVDAAFEALLKQKDPWRR